MAAKGTSCVNSHRSPREFMYLLSSATCEWFFIFLLFVNGTLSYLLTKFARYCDLQTHCLICARLDHVFENEKPHFYCNLLCSNHKVEISSLVYCDIHDKLADVRDMCEECLMSFITKNKSSPLFIGKLGADFERSGFISQFSNNNFVPDSVSTRYCSCCNMSWRSKSNARRLLQIAPIGYGAKANVKPPLPRTPGRSRFSRRDSMKKMRDKFSEPTKPRIDPHSHVGYSELKFTSDSDSEFQFSDDDQRSLENLTRTTPQTQQASLLDQNVQLYGSETRDAKCSAWHGLRELIWPNPNPNPNPKPNPSSLPELISLNDVPPSSNVVGSPIDTLSRESSGFALSELSLLDVISPSIAEASPLSDIASDIGHTSVSKHAEFEELKSTRSEPGLKIDHFLDNDVDSSNVSKSVVSNKELAFEVSSVHLKQPPLESKRVQEDAKLSPLHVSSTVGNDGMQHVDHEELGRSESSSSNGIPSLQKSTSLERKDSGYESIDGISTLSEIEGESVVDRLKRQIEHDKQCMSALYKELEEERNAASVAANEAMAMITRLQEEKAALHMEALQYLRMMEEQAEYDMDALEKANDLLAEKEKEIQDLEAEFEFYKNIIEDSMVLHDETYHLNGGQSMLIKNNAYVSSNSMIVEGSDKAINVKTSSIIEDSMVLHDESYDLNGDQSMMVDKIELHCIENNAYVPSNSMIVEGSDNATNVNTSSIMEDSMILHDETYNLNGDQSMMVDNNDLHCIKNNVYVPSNSTIVEGSDKVINVKTSSIIEDSMVLQDESYDLKGDQSPIVDNNDLNCIKNNAYVPSNSMIVEGSDKAINVKTSSIVENSMSPPDETHNLKGEINNNDLHCIENNANVPSNPMIVEGSDKTINVKTSSDSYASEPPA